VFIVEKLMNYLNSLLIMSALVLMVEKLYRATVSPPAVVAIRVKEAKNGPVG
jgi:hypothetical protein